MPDLARVAFWHCLTAEEWSVDVKGKTGTYTVTWDRHGHGNHSVQYDYSCTCMGYRFHKTCSHIKKVKEENLRCGWMQFSDGGEPIVIKGQKRCPHCRGELSSAIHGV